MILWGKVLIQCSTGLSKHHPTVSICRTGFSLALIVTLHCFGGVEGKHQGCVLAVFWDHIHLYSSCPYWKITFFEVVS